MSEVISYGAFTNEGKAMWSELQAIGKHYFDTGRMGILYMGMGRVRVRICGIGGRIEYERTPPYIDRVKDFKETLTHAICLHYDPR